MMFPYSSIGRTNVLYSIGTVCSSKFSKLFLIIIIYILKSNIQCISKYEFSGCTQYGLYNLKQYDHSQILNDLIHITLLHTINICAE